MCGIIVILQTTEDAQCARKRALTLSAKLRHRGPDWSGEYLSCTSETPVEWTLVYSTCC